MPQKPTSIEVQTLCVSDHDYRSILTSLVDHAVAGYWTMDDIKAIRQTMMEAVAQTLPEGTPCKIVAMSEWKWIGCNRTSVVGPIPMAAEIQGCVIVSAVMGSDGAIAEYQSCDDL